jgi:hypothetical protein
MHATCCHMIKPFIDMSEISVIRKSLRISESRHWTNGQHLQFDL